MSALLKSLLGGTPAQEPLNPAEDPDFADFAGVPDPSPASSVVNSAASSLSAAASPTSSSAPIPITFRPYTKWYRVWERVELRDFTTEFYLIPIILLIVFAHVYGARKNRRKVRSWITTHGPILEQEYAYIGFDKPAKPTSNSEDTTTSPGSGPSDPAKLYGLLKEKKVTEYATYATGRQNVAFADIKLTFLRRQNPMGLIGEEILGFFFESQPAPRERLEATTYVFDGREAELVPSVNKKADADGKVTLSEGKKDKFNSHYDGFVFAIVHKECMKQMRQARYDLSLTSTKEHAKLPGWCVIMSESSEVTEALLTGEMCKAVEGAGEDAFEALVVSDMPVESPSKLNDLQPRKRLNLTLRLPPSPTSSYSRTTPIFRLFIRLPDFLTNTAHFRPEALRRVRATRDEEAKKIKKVFEDEKAEERRTNAEKAKKGERDAKLRGLSAEEQRKFLERERIGDLRKGQRKGAKKG